VDRLCGRRHSGCHDLQDRVKRFLVSRAVPPAGERPFLFSLWRRYDRFVPVGASFYPPQVGPLTIFMRSKQPMINESSSEETRTHCIRCGECCLRSSPTLQAEDLRLIEVGRLERKNLMTLRKGEIVTDPVSGSVGPATHEGIKIREKKGTERGCILYDGTAKACTIYDDRPLQCRALTCWDTREIMDILGRPKLKRRDAVKDGVLLGLIEKHDETCSYAALEKQIRKISRAGNSSVERLLDILKFDFHLRPFVSEKLNLPMEEMDFFFGRPLVDTITAYGLQVLRLADGSFFLTTTKGKVE
jgi:Fe-S-cluster containining protein